MASLLNEEEKAIMKDDFYSTTYGGFTEENDDKDFAYQSPNEEDDAVDSDFSIDENDEPKSDADDEDGEGKKRPKRSAGVVTKAYKEPSKKDLKVLKPRDKPIAPKEKLKKKPVTPVRTSTFVTEFGRKEARASTVNKTAETAKRQKEREIRAKRLLRKKQRSKKNQMEDKELTQEELLEEAKETEKLNIASLKRYEEMELEAKKKAVKSTKRAISGPFIRYLSTSMPLVQELDAKSSATEEKISVDDDNEEAVKNEKVEAEKASSSRAPKHERTFLTFSDHDTLRETFPQKKPRVTQQKICPITRLPAKYVDPVTRLPYANLQAFKFLRDHYYNQLELKGDKDDPEVAAWLEWRRKNKPAKPTHLAQVNRPPQPFTQVARSPALNANPLPQVVLDRHVNSKLTYNTNILMLSGQPSKPSDSS